MDLITQLTTVLVSCSALVLGQNLSFVVTNSRLPTPVHSHSAVYDGEGAIYVIGGIINNTDYQNRVVKYSLESGAVEEVGTFINIANGAAVMRGQDIFYIGGYNSVFYSDIYRYSTNTSDYAPVNQLPSPAVYSAAVMIPTTGYTFTFGGTGNDGIKDDIFWYDTSNNDVGASAARLPEARYRAAAVWDNRRRVAYVLGGISEASCNIVQFEGEISNLPVLLPFDVPYPCAAYADSTDDVYLIGGPELVRFSPGSLRVEPVHVDGWPCELNRAACVYVPQLDRIYVLGGQGSSNCEPSEISAEISYIDLNPSVPDPTTTTTTTTTTSSTTTTTARPPPQDCSDGQIHVIPDPFCCESFYFCFGGEGTKNVCPNGRHFDPDTLQCEEEELVGCRISYDRRGRGD